MTLAQSHQMMIEDGAPEECLRRGAMVPAETMRLPAVASESIALVNMIERVARDPSVDIERMERLIEMKERILAREAKVAFDTAFAEMQPDLPIIAEKGVHGGTQSSYAKWDDVTEAIKPALAKHGFSFRCKIRQDANKVIITGILSHRGGHSEETPLELPLDTGGQKNPVQAIGSSVSYGQRYVAKAMLSLSSRKSDDDNGDAAGGNGAISDEQAMTIRELAESVGADIAKFCTYFKVKSIAEIPAKQFDRAISALEAKRKKAS